MSIKRVEPFIELRIDLRIDLRIELRKKRHMKFAFVCKANN